MLISIVGNMVPVPFIILFIRRVFEWMRGKSPKLASVVEKMEAKAYAKRELIRKWELLGLFVLVAVPLPGTGAWTGALVAALLDLRVKSAFLTILLGMITAALIMTVGSSLVTAAMTGEMPQELRMIMDYFNSLSCTAG